MSTKTFHVSDLLSLHPGYLVSRDHIGGVYNVLNHMTQDDLMTHQLPLAWDAVLPDLFEQHPWLKDVPHPAEKLTSEADCVAYVASIAEVHGEWHEVKSASMSWGTHDPMRDLRNEWPDKRIVAIQVPD